MPRWRILGLDKENLKRLYIDKQLPVYKIAKELSVTDVTVSRYLRKYGIPLRKHGDVMKRKTYPDKYVAGLTPVILKKLYTDDWLTTIEIAKQFKCTATTVVKTLKRYDIPLHTSRIKGMDEITLRRFYIDKEWSTIRIAEHFGCKTDETVRKALQRYGIRLRSRAEAGKIKLISEKELVRIRAMGLATRSGENHPAWRGGRRVNNYGYVILRIDKKDILEHRYVMEQHLNRKLEPWEEVNLINGDKLNNNSDNLEVIYSEHKHKDHLRRQAQQQS